jgi:hypothetical protein
MRTGLDGIDIIALSHLQYLLSDLQKQLHHLAFQRCLRGGRFHSLLRHFEQLESVYFLKHPGWDSAGSVPLEAEERSFVKLWEQAATRRGKAFENLPSVEHLDEIEFTQNSRRSKGHNSEYLSTLILMATNNHT